VVNPTRVAKVKRVDDLDEDTLDQLIVSEERELPDDGVKIASTEVADKEGVAARINLTVECENVRVG
jgi:hypothetical protein